jgi:hypothetical protein
MLNALLFTVSDMEVVDAHKFILKQTRTSLEKIVRKVAGDVSDRARLDFLDVCVPEGAEQLAEYTLRRTFPELWVKE